MAFPILHGTAVHSLAMGSTNEELIGKLCENVKDFSELLELREELQGVRMFASLWEWKSFFQALRILLDLAWRITEASLSDKADSCV